MCEEAFVIVFVVIKVVRICVMGIMMCMPLFE